MQNTCSLNNNFALKSELSFANSWTVPVTTSYRALHVIRNGNQVILSGAVRCGTISNWTTITTLPAGFRPKSPTQYRAFVMFGNTVFFNLLIGFDGIVQIYNASGLTANTTEVFISVVFSVD